MSVTETDKIMALVDGYKRGSVRFDFLRAAVEQLVAERDALKRHVERVQAESHEFKLKWKSEAGGALGKLAQAEARIAELEASQAQPVGTASRFRGLWNVDVDADKMPDTEEVVHLCAAPPHGRPR